MSKNTTIYDLKLDYTPNNKSIYDMYALKHIILHFEGVFLQTDNINI